MSDVRLEVETNPKCDIVGSGIAFKPKDLCVALFSLFI
jgi:hypothetical protein